MKKFLLSFLCFLLAVGGYAEEVTFNFKELYGDATLSSIDPKTVDGITISYEKNSGTNVPAFNKDGTLRLYYGSGKGCSATFTTDGTKKITKAVINAKTTPTVNYSVDGDKLSTGTWAAKVMTISNISASQTLMIQNANITNTQLQIYSIILTVEANSGEGGEIPEPEEPETPVAPSTPTLTPSNSFDNEMSVEITNISEGSTVYYTIDESTPSASNGTEYSDPFKITETTTVKAIAVNEAGSSDVVSATYTKNEVSETPENVEGGTVTFTASEYGFSNQASVTTVQMGDYVTVEFNKGTNPSGNSPKYYTTGTAIRCYGGNTFTIKSTAGNITKIVLTYSSGDDSNKITTNVGTFTTDTWTGSNQSVTFTISETSGHRRIAGISVTYEGTNSDTPEVENVQAPVISCNKEEYAVGEEAIVTITTATDGATIYYSLDGNDPTTEYTSAITLYETTTIKAIAKKVDANNSPLAEKTIVFKEVVTLVNATVAEAIAAYKSGNTITANASIVGYIVGAANNSLSNDGNFSGTTTVDANLLIADDPNETNVENCMPVQLPSGIRSALNLKDNPSNYKRRVILTGTVETYFSVAGLKKTSAYEFVEDSWGTLYSSGNIDIPETVKAYIVTGANSNYVSLEQIAGAAPANTGIIYYGFWRPDFTAVSKKTLADVGENLLEGTATNSYISEAAYVLAKVDGEVGFYKAAMNQLDGTAFLNNANKAYLPVDNLPSSVQNAKALKFDFCTTAVESVKVETTGKRVIYDLSGRRVNEMAQPGIYIVNGKKVMVK